MKKELNNAERTAAIVRQSAAVRAEIWRLVQLLGMQPNNFGVLRISPGLTVLYDPDVPQAAALLAQPDPYSLVVESGLRPFNGHAEG